MGMKRQNDLISRSALIEEIKAEIENLTKEKRDYSERGIYHNAHMMGERITGAKSVLKAVENQPTAYDVEKVVEVIEKLPVQDFLGVAHIPRTAVLNRIKRSGYCELS